MRYEKFVVDRGGGGIEEKRETTTDDYCEGSCIEGDRAVTSKWKK